METVLITGGSGLIGTRLTQLLIEKGYNVVHLTRKKKDRASGIIQYKWDIINGLIDDKALLNAHYIVHLAGAGVAECRWSEGRKKEIRSSRVESTRLLYEVLRREKGSVKGFFSASAIGIYKKNIEALQNEYSEVDSDFLAKVCREWEASADDILSLGIRTVKVRTGIVLSARGGALPKMVFPVKMFAGAPLGTGRQFMSWIHIDDICGVYIKAIEDETIEGVYNAVSPFPVSNSDMTYAIAHILKRPLLLPAIPEFFFRVLFGEMSTILIDGQQVSAKKVIKAGYKFKFFDLNNALKNLLGSV